MLQCQIQKSLYPANAVSTCQAFIVQLRCSIVRDWFTYRLHCRVYRPLIALQNFEKESNTYFSEVVPRLVRIEFLKIFNHSSVRSRADSFLYTQSCATDRVGGAMHPILKIVANVMGYLIRAAVPLLCTSWCACCRSRTGSCFHWRSWLDGIWAVHLQTWFMLASTFTGYLV